MPVFKVLKEEGINGRRPSPVGTEVILSAEEAAPFVASKVLEAVESAPEPSPSVSPIAPTEEPNP